MIPSIAALTAADEHFNHQIVNTHAAVGTPDEAAAYVKAETAKAMLSPWKTFPT